MMIISTATRLCNNDDTGQPRKGWNLESGPWASHDVTSALSTWADIDAAFRQAGFEIRINRARSSRGKARLENTIGRIQTLSDFGRGFVGRDERHVDYEHVRKFVASLKRCTQPNKEPIHPGSQLMSFAQFEAHLRHAIERYNNEPQCGEWLRDRNLCGLSPAEGWRYFKSSRPMFLLDERLQYLTASVERKQKVTPEGVSVRIGGWTHRYRGSEKLALLLGQRVKVRYNPEFPERVHVAAIGDEEHPFTVPLARRLPARSATQEQFEMERADAALFANLGQTRFLHFAPPENVTLRDAKIGASKLRRVGEAHNRLEREQVDLENRRNAARHDIHELASKHRISIDVDRLEDPNETLQLLLEAESADAEARELEEQKVKR